MKIDQIIDNLDNSTTMIGRWKESDSVPTIERDIVLTSLQNIYKQILALPSQVVAPYESPIEHGKVEFIIEADEQIEEPQQETEYIDEEPVYQAEPEQSNEPMEEVRPEPVIEEEEPEEPQFRVIFGQSVSTELIDAFIMELFWRDEQFFINEVSKLSNQPSLDAALIYICEKYNWSADSVAAEKFTELLANNKFE